MNTPKNSRYRLEMSEIENYIDEIEVGTRILTLRKVFGDTASPKFVVETDTVTHKYPFLIETKSGTISNVQAFLLNRLGQIA